MESFGSKQSWEAYYVAFDFGPVLAEGDSIASATVTAADPQGTDATSTVTTAANQNIDGAVVNVWVKAGTSGKTYKLTCKAVSLTAAEQFELEAEIPVLDI